MSNNKREMSVIYSKVSMNGHEVDYVLSLADYKCCVCQREKDKYFKILFRSKIAICCLRCWAKAVCEYGDDDIEHSIDMFSRFVNKCKQGVDLSPLNEMGQKMQKWAELKKAVKKLEEEILTYFLSGSHNRSFLNAMDDLRESVGGCEYFREVIEQARNS